MGSVHELPSLHSAPPTQDKTPQQAAPLPPSLPPTAQLSHPPAERRLESAAWAWLTGMKGTGKLKSVSDEKSKLAFGFFSAILAPSSL